MALYVTINDSDVQCVDCLTVFDANDVAYVQLRYAHDCASKDNRPPMSDNQRVALYRKKI